MRDRAAKPGPRPAAFRLAGALLCLALAAAPADRVAAAEHDQVLQSQAAELLDGLERADPARWRRVGEPTRVAIWPFSQEQVPISQARANGFNDALLKALIERAPRDYVFVERRQLGTVVRELEESGQGIGDAIAAVARAAAADVLVIGTIALDGGRASLSYKALAVNGEAVGEVLAVTAARPIAIDIGEARITLDQGIARAARRFADQAGDMTVLRLAGVRFQTSRIQTAFGGYVEGKVADVLSELFANLVTGRRLTVERAELGAERLSELRGSDAPAEALRPESFDPRPGAYVLSGQYWELGRAVELRLALRDGAGRVIAWRDLVKPPPGLGLRPSAEVPAALLANDGLGPVRLVLSSARGDDPVHRVGDRLQLVVQTDRDAWLHCYYRQSDRKWYRIFPNRYHADARLAGNRLHTIPDHGYPFDLNITRPTGVDLVKCFALTRDVAGALPPAARSPVFAPLPEGMGLNLPALFREAAGAEVSEASLVITVIP